MTRVVWLIAMVVVIPAMGGAQAVLTRAELITLMKQSGPAAWNYDVSVQLRALVPADLLLRRATNPRARLAPKTLGGMPYTRRRQTAPEDVPA